MSDVEPAEEDLNVDPAEEEYDENLSLEDIVIAPNLSEDDIFDQLEFLTKNDCISSMKVEDLTDPGNLVVMKDTLVNNGWFFANSKDGRYWTFRNKIFFTKIR